MSKQLEHAGGSDGEYVTKSQKGAILSLHEWSGRPVSECLAAVRGGHRSMAKLINETRGGRSRTSTAAKLMQLRVMALKMRMQDLQILQLERR
jgi:hypothetical protein